MLKLFPKLAEFIKSKLTYARTVEAFDEVWAQLKSTFPTPWAIKYLESELISCRERWAQAFTQKFFTMGYSCSTMAEVQNHVIACWLSPTMKLAVSNHCSFFSLTRTLTFSRHNPNPSPN